MAIKRSAGKQEKPPWMIIHGPEKVGKSQFAAGIDHCLHIDVEKGTLHLDIRDRAVVDEFSDFDSVLTALDRGDITARFVCIDTTDKLEELIWRDICEDRNVKGIEDFGYGKGFQYALDKWREVWMRLRRLSESKNMGIILIAHSVVRPFRNPIGHDWDRWTMKMHEKAARFLMEQVDLIGFANYESTMGMVAAPKGSKAKPVDRVKFTGARLLHLEREAGFDAGSRWPMPSSIPLEWAAFIDAWRAGQSKPPAWFHDEIAALVATIDDADLAGKVESAVKDAGDNTDQLARILNRVKARAYQIQQERAAAAPSEPGNPEPEPAAA